MTEAHAVRLPDPVFRVASPQGDIPFTPGMAHMPLEGCPLSTTYGEYFAGLRDFSLGPGGAALVRAASQAAGRPLDTGEITGLVVTAQKHGALYHPASIEVRFQGGAALFGANVATGPHGWAAIAREHAALVRLTRDIPAAQLPRPLHFEEGDRLDILLADWFSGFHEFHVSTGGDVVVWNFEGGGISPLGLGAAREAYRQAARILALCLDLETGARIWPWRHAAGDFVVSPGGGPDALADVRLITAREYAPPAAGGGLAGLAHFFLATTLFMRLDRQDGVGERVFLPVWSLEAAVDGILAGLAVRAAARIPELAAVLRGVAPGRWIEIAEKDADLCADPDAEFLFPRLPEHLAELADILGRLP
jgi:hypothetical protein